MTNPLTRRTLDLISGVLLVVAIVAEVVGAACSFTVQGHPGGWIATGLALAFLSMLL